MKILSRVFLLIAVCLLSVSCSVLPQQVRQTKNKEAEAEAQANKDAQAEVKKLLNLALGMCGEIYPAMTFAKCMDKLKHAMGDAFDPHTGFKNAEEAAQAKIEMGGKFGIVGIKFQNTSNPTQQLLVDAVIKGSPADKAGIMPGDALVSVNEMPIQTFSDIAKATSLLRGEPGSSVHIKVLRGGDKKPFEYDLVRYEISLPNMAATILRRGNKRYALFPTRVFGEGFAPELKDKYLALAKEANVSLSGVIISVEDNPGGYVDEAYNALHLFMKTDSMILFRDKDGIEQYEPNSKNLMESTGDITHGLPVLVIINERSASASEIFAGVMKHSGRAVIAGTSASFGKGTSQTYHHLEGGEAAAVTTSEYLIGSESDWVPVQCIGVTPDILFEYKGIKKEKSRKECEGDGHITSIGKMNNAPPHQSIKDKDPVMYKEALQMLEAFKAYRQPMLLEAEKTKKTRK